jgi:hypothetical protein
MSLLRILCSLNNKLSELQLVSEKFSNCVESNRQSFFVGPKPRCMRWCPAFTFHSTKPFINMFCLLSRFRRLRQALLGCVFLALISTLSHAILPAGEANALADFCNSINGSAIIPKWNCSMASMACETGWPYITCVGNTTVTTMCVVPLYLHCGLSSSSFLYSL